MNELNYIGMIYEGIILIPVILLIFFAFRNYLKNKAKLSLLLFLILTFYGISIVFSWYSKILSIFYNLPYLEIQDVPDPGTFLSWILLRISYFRFTFLFINLAILYSFQFKNAIFNKSHKKNYVIFIYSFAVFNSLFSVIFFEKMVLILDVLIFFLTLIFECIIYIPFFIESLKIFKITQNLKFKRKFLDLMIMSLSFVLVLFCLFVDRFFIFMGWGSYSFFYFVSWLFVLLGILTAYRGYLK